MAPATLGLEQDLREIQARIKQVDAEASEKQQAAEDLVAKLKADGKNPLTDQDAFAQVDEAYKAADTLKDEAATLREKAQAAMSWMGRTREHGNGAGFGQKQSIAERVLEHIAALGYDEPAIRGQAAFGGNLSGVDVLTRAEAVRALRSGRMFQAAATADLDSGIPLDQRLYPPVEVLRRQIRLLNLITVGQTNVESVVYARQTVRTSAAAETALGTAYGEASFDFEKVTAPVKSIGHFTTAYRENIADAAQFETIVENQLGEDVMLRLESQILSGDGSGDNLTGILNSGIESVTRDTTNERRVEAIHRAITVVRLAFREPDAILLHPNDFQDTLFEKAEGTGIDGGGYVWVGALNGLSQDTPGSLWGKPVVVSPVASEGTGLVAYWKDATLWQRTGVSIRLSDSHSDYFTKRQVAILADMRGAFSVQRPGVFCKVVDL